MPVTLLNPNQTLVSLNLVKEACKIPTTDPSNDALLTRWITAVAPVIESITGPILPRMYDEVYDGGQHFVQLRHRPVMELMACSEYRGPIEYVLQIIQSPDQGQIYSCQLDGSRVVRRSAGGGIIGFPSMPQSVHVVYAAGYQTAPANVVEGTLELLRIRFQHSQQGRPRGGLSSDEDGPGREIMGFLVPYEVREWLVPNRRHASVA